LSAAQGQPFAQLRYAVQPGSAEQVDAIVPAEGSQAAPVARYWLRQLLQLEVVTVGAPPPQ